MTNRIKSFYLINIIYLVGWTALAFNVSDRQAWLLENLLVFVFLGPAVYYFLKGTLSQTAYLLLFIFASFHAVGAHYTYSLVPYDDWFFNLLGFRINATFGWERNHYDRLVHFSWGLLLYKSFLDIFYREVKVRGYLLIVLTLFTIVTTSTIYELIEWLAAIIFSKDLGMVAYVGAQGDPWDAHKDQALAIIGAMVGSAIFWRSED